MISSAREEEEEEKNSQSLSVICPMIMCISSVLQEEWSLLTTLRIISPEFAGEEEEEECPEADGVLTKEEA